MKCPPNGHYLVTASVQSVGGAPPSEDWRPDHWPPDDFRAAGCTCPSIQPLKKGTVTFDQCCPLHEINRRPD